MKYCNNNGIIFNNKRELYMDTIKKKFNQTKFGKKINKHINEVKDGINMAKQVYDEASNIIDQVVVHNTGDFSTVWHQHPESGHYYAEDAIEVEGECKEDSDEDVDGI